MKVADENCKNYTTLENDPILFSLQVFRACSSSLDILLMQSVAINWACIRHSMNLIKSHI